MLALREALLGKLRVEHQVLIHEPGHGEVQAVLRGCSSQQVGNISGIKGLVARRQEGATGLANGIGRHFLYYTADASLAYYTSYDCQRSVDIVANLQGQSRHFRVDLLTPPTGYQYSLQRHQNPVGGPPNISPNTTTFRPHHPSIIQQGTIDTCDGMIGLPN